jgi:hypothetical protein
VTLTFSGFHKLNAVTGAADHDRHDPQWQYPIASGAPLTSISTAPQKQRPPYVAMVVPPFFAAAAIRNLTAMHCRYIARRRGHRNDRSSASLGSSSGNRQALREVSVSGIAPSASG